MPHEQIRNGDDELYLREPERALFEESQRTLNAIDEAAANGDVAEAQRLSRLADDQIGRLKQITEHKARNALRWIGQGDTERAERFKEVIKKPAERFSHFVQQEIDTLLNQEEPLTLADAGYFARLMGLRRQAESETAQRLEAIDERTKFGFN